jgi:hypothetical protein
LDLKTEPTGNLTKRKVINLKKQSSLALAALLFSLAPALSADTLVYNNVPSPLPTNLPSVGYEANSISEFGQGVSLAGGSAVLTTAQIVLSDWALESTYEAIGTSTGFYVPLTLNLYDVGANDSVGSLFASYTITPEILWRPEASAGCGTAFLGANGTCYNGLAQVVTFDLGDVTAPGQFIYGLSFNTSDYGVRTGVSGPYDSLNFAVAGGTPSIGSDLVANSAYMDSSSGGVYGDGGSGGVGTFRLDAGAWAGYDPAASFEATPEPSAITLSMLAGAILLLFRKKLRTV